MKKYGVKIILIFMVLLVLSSTLQMVNGASYNQVILEANEMNSNGIDLFPKSYQDLLRKLLDNTGHTNWKFRPFYTEIDWNELVINETDCLHNTLYQGKPGSWYHSCGLQGDKGYYCASKEITSYYMDPRNFLTEKTIFQFLDLSNSSEVSVQEISKAVEGTYLAGSVNGESYAQMIYDAAKESGEGAFSIIVRIFQELGNGTSLPYMISGNDPTYPGVYNFFNYGATDGEGNLKRGLKYAYEAGWTTPRKALIEGAKLIAGTYTKAGQVNKYLYKFDVVGSEKSELYRHQYMTNIQDPNSQASNLYKTYDQSNLLDKELTFVIPVYRGMPASIKKPTNENPNGNLYYVSSNYDSVYWRTSPGGSIIGSLEKDTVVTMLQENVDNSGFGKISCNGTVGYMSMEYLTNVNRKEDIYEIPSQGTQYLGGERRPDANISYTVQLQNIGWTGWANDGETIGTIGEHRRLETLKISLGDAIKSEEVQYRVHAQDYGWMNWVSDGELAGTVGESKRVESIQIKLKDTENYNILYRVCIEGKQWTDWVMNGESAGTTGKSESITAIEIKLEKLAPWDDRGTIYKGTETPKETAQINYNTCLQKVGWTGWIADGESAGSAEQGRKLEAIKIELGKNVVNESIKYRVHMQDYGWMDWTTEGNIAGLENQSKRMEAIQIQLTNGTNYELQYRVHVQDIGWMNWVSNGELAGTEGKMKRIEAIQIKLIPKQKLGISYMAHVQDYGWMDWVSNGELAGTEGECKRVESIKIKLDGLNTSITNAIQYRVHVQDIGWMDWVSDGELAGTEGLLKRIEAIEIKLNPQLGKKVNYRVHVQDIGWMDWVSDGELAGTEGQLKRIEAIEIKIEN